ncbi:putative homing endonuclease [Salmonella phage allotria]|nr:homing endonuclease [Salmonella phage allotria]YP_009889063.1 homing endonuclease [Salmonella phage pertopsoe]YP_009889263.1 homing endonuclease [Salmonella phage maane]WDR21124.1 putative membrane protein [Salmonella phage vB_SenM_UTK0004]WIL01905.1 putative homing endonuclease [Salmonella phage D5lw]QIO02463.1 putative homing endonuclease [Salmonella phage allotria]QIO03335.1 putative homing endonuclease [Salmonella phage pertopsoe]QIO03535.1 putative homing endonuclease [Salmonella pha
MDHNKIYNLIIANAKGRPKAVGLETHHIIPRCVGGTNDESNLVNLTRREHFVCHRLLARNGGKLELSFRMIRNRTRSGNKGKTEEIMILLQFVLKAFAFGLIACGVITAMLLIIALIIPFKRKR